VAVAAHESPGVVAAALRRRFGDPAEALARRLDALERQRYGPPGATADAAADWAGAKAAARALAATLAAGARPAPGLAKLGR
jgi:hypothetical protein